MTSCNHVPFDSPKRDSQPLCNEGCQNILYKAVFEHFTEIRDVAALLLTSKSFQNSSFGPNLLVNWEVDRDSIQLLDSILTPSSCFSMQFAPSLHIKQLWAYSEEVNGSIANFARGIVNTKYLRSSLRSLSFEEVTDEVISSFFGNSSKAWQQLRELSAYNSGGNDVALKLISKNALQLRTLILSHNSAITDVGLGHISNLVNITSLDLRYANMITDVGIGHLSKKLSGITFLNLEGCEKITDAGLKFVSKIPGISSLNLGRCRLITDGGIEQISTLSGIKVLDLTMCKEVTDAGLEYISKMMSSITSLDLCRCSLITDVGLDHLSKCSLISFLKITGCENVTDAGLAHIAKLTGITNLNFAFCELVTDAGLHHVSQLSNISSLALSYCCKITDAGIEHLVKLSRITTLNLAGCCLMTDAGFQLIAKLSEITFVDLTECDSITATATKKLKAVRPNCKVHYDY